jgi:hypothetical protein
VTEVNGLRLAYRGLVAGLAAGWVWLAIALGGLLLAGADPIAISRGLGNGTAESGFIAGLAMAQITAGGIGLFFAYFFGRYFTVRFTLAAAAPAFALLAWLALARLTGADTGAWPRQLVLVLAALAYGLMLGGAIPVRGEVLRTP